MLALRLAVLPLVLATSACDGCSRIAEPPPMASATKTPSIDATPRQPPTLAPTLVAQRPHDPRAFTQGLIFVDGELLESTGEYGESSLRRVVAETGRVVRSVALEPNVFGEGLARLHGEIFQLTWQEHRCFVYDAATLEKRRELTYAGEGWGLTTDGDALLVMSDGSSALRFMEPDSFRVVRTVAVRHGAQPLVNLNELEWVRGEVLANVWRTKLIARIDPRSGDVRSFVDLSGLPEPEHDDPDAVLNGIAYDAKSDRLFVTGKRWSSTYEIRLPD